MRRMRLLAMLLLLLLPALAAAHHVLGRPSYSLNEDSNTPPSMQVETQIGKYFVTYMVFPAFPQPGKPGRINLYVKRMSDDRPFQGKVRFTVRDDGWFVSDDAREELGVQEAVDNVFRQGFVISEPGDYLVIAEFEADGEPYRIDFPLRIGDPSPVGPLGLALGVIIVLLIAVNLLQRRRLARLKTREYHAREGA